jgi:hypothetical protein
MENKNKERYVDENLELWKEKYNIPLDQEFNLKALFGLQYDFMATPSEHVKAKKDLIEAMQLIQRNLNLTPKKKLEKLKKLIIVVNNSSHLKEVFEIIELMLGTNVKFVVNANTHGHFETDNLEIDIYIKSDKLRGKRCDMYWNLTGDLNFENEVLKPMVIH